MQDGYPFLTVSAKLTTRNLAPVASASCRAGRIYRAVGRASRDSAQDGEGSPLQTMK